MNRSRNDMLDRPRDSERRMTAGVLLRVALIAAAAPAASAQTITGLGFLPGGSWSGPSAMSADGSTVVGTASTPNGYRTFRWTRGGGMEDLGIVPGTANSAAGAVSADGSVVVGTCQDTSLRNRGFRWTRPDGMRDLGLLPGALETWAAGVSSDGSTIVGFTQLVGWSYRAFRWTSADGMQALSTLPSDYPTAMAFGISADGLVVVGRSRLTPDGLAHAVRWNGDGRIEDLGALTGWDGQAMDASANGSTIVGYSVSDAFHAFRWTSTSGIQDLGTWTALAVSDNGAVLVGQSFGSDLESPSAVLWDQTKGLTNLNTYLPSIGIDLTGWRLEGATGISADGLTIVGYGTHWSQSSSGVEGWIATLSRACRPDFNGDGVVNSQDFFDYLNAFFAGDARADIDLDGTVTSSDFFDFLDAFFAGCP